MAWNASPPGGGEGGGGAGGGGEGGRGGGEAGGGGGGGGGDDGGTGGSDGGADAVWQSRGGSNRRLRLGGRSMGEDVDGSSSLMLAPSPGEVDGDAKDPD